MYGNVPSVIDLLNKSDNGSAIKSAVILSILTGMLSGPVDLFGSKAFNILKTSCGHVSIWSRVGIGLFCVGLSGGCLESGMLRVDWAAK